MRFFIWSSKQEQGPYEAGQITALLADGTITSATLGREEDHPGEWKPLTSLPGVITPVTESVQADKTLSEGAPQAYLESVRKQSCYSTLRGMIDLLAVLSILGIVTLAGLYTFSGVRNDSTLTVVVGIVVGLLGCFLVVAFKQASLLLVDIADILIDRNRKKRNE